MRDNQRSKLYRAEGFMNPGRHMRFVDDAQDYVNDLTSQRWFRSRWGNKHIEVKDGRGRRSACGSFYGEYIKLPVWARSELVILHEVAHVLVPPKYASHGPEYAGVLLFLARQFGTVDAAKLRESFRTQRVRISNRAIPAVGSHVVRTKSQVKAARVAAKARPVGVYEAREAAEVIRRAVKIGRFGPSGGKPRVHALATARALENLLSS